MKKLDDDAFFAVLKARLTNSDNWVIIIADGGPSYKGTNVKTLQQERKLLEDFLLGKKK